jgi:hypothetical protein
MSANARDLVKLCPNPRNYTTFTQILTTNRLELDISKGNSRRFWLTLNGGYVSLFL